MPTPPELEWQDRIDHILDNLPAATWTAYGELGRAVGRGPRQVARYLSTEGTRNAYRVLRSNGRVSDGFHWNHPEHKTAREVLSEEGIHFDRSGRADPHRRLDADDLIELMRDYVPYLCERKRGRGQPVYGLVSGSARFRPAGCGPACGS
ncbi:MGMT family protein [Haloglycomyces albus]|uniref:MGMT family protein n=1 Tax=Haloglycomyces albus TaxID=526067 RepID=UPI00046D276C|nr:MGMT family protein [Haloglycomyces albus]